MAIVIEANYSKKIGLPAFSSHSYSVTIRSEVADLGQVERESAKLYTILQGSVDRELQEVGFSPGPEPKPDPSRFGNGSRSNGDHWNCSDKQRELILRVIDENRIDKQEVEALSKERFNLPVKSLDKLQASGLIEELLSKYAPKKEKNGYARGGRR